MFLKIGHRGAAGHEPENTIRSFRRALALGADAIEFDVRATADEKLVVIHDSRVDRTTNGTGRVRDLKFLDLYRLKAGKGEKIPELISVLLSFGQATELHIELKEYRIVKKVLAEIQDLGLAKRVVVSAFDGPDNEPGGSSNWVDLLWLKKEEPDVRIALLTEKPQQIYRALNLAGAYPVWAINPAAVTVNQSLVEQIHARGCLIFPWTVDDPQEIARIKTMGADGIFSNYPDRL